MATSQPLVEFGPFRLDPSRRLLWRRDELVAVTPRALEVLAALVERPGEVVGKQELMERVWPDTFVEEANLSVNVSALRKALGAGASGRPYIETVSRRGYRFVGAAKPVHDALRSLAVLPFRPIAPTGDDEALGIGMADALITRLGALGPLSVRPTGAVARFASGEVDAQAAGRELSVDAVLEGRVQRDAGRIRATVQLVSVPDGASLWAHTFEEPFTGIFAVQDAISQRVAQALTLRLGPAARARLARHATEDVEAYQAYVKGRYFWNKLTGPRLEKARECFEAALAIDPDYSLAHTGLADTFLMLGLYGLRPAAEAWSRARQAAERALACDDSNADAHISLAYVRLFQEWAFGAAERELRRALELAPTSASVRQWYALYLAMIGRFGEALEAVQRAQELDPLSLTAHTNAGFQFYLTRQHDSEISEHMKTLEMEPDYAVGHWALALAYEQKEMYAEAISEHEKAVLLSGASVVMRANLGRAYALAGRKADARAVLRELVARSGREPVSAYRIATVHLALGDADEGMAWLERAAAARDHWMVWLKVDPMLEPVRADRRFPRLLAAVGFPSDEAEPRKATRAAATGSRVRRTQNRKASRRR